jgi:diguanylate cyclase (GGDEF)-like protein
MASAPPRLQAPERLPMDTGMSTVRGLLTGAWLRELVARGPNGQRSGLGWAAGQAAPEGPAAEATTQGGSRWPRWLGAWLVLACAVLVAVAAGYGITRIHRYATESNELRVLLGELETAARHESALRWQAIAEQQFTPSVAAAWEAVDESTHELAERLQALDSTSREAHAIHEAFERYDTAVEHQFELLAKGRVAEVERVDKQRVQPAFAALLEAQAAARRHYRALAERANRRADLGTQLILLAAAIIIGALVWRFQRARSQAAGRFAYQALHDPLTGLPNRILLRDRAGQAIRGADRELTPVALLLLDLDRFKEVNDTLGHHYGDQLLVQVGQRLRAALRGVDTVARLGGDEFAVLLPKITTSEGAVAVAKKLQAALEEPFALERLALEVEASIGLALYPEHGNDPEELLQHADIAMYVAKETHAGFVLFDPTQDQHSPRRLALLGELRRAIDTGQLVLHYQPKIDTHSGRVLGVEALVRWQHPTHGLIPPDEFIPLAERTGLITPLTHYVLDAALRQCRQWHQDGHELNVAVNISARRMLDPAFPDEVADLLATWQLPARLLVLEITESTMMADPQHALEVLSRLHSMGVQLSIDDFGTGYSSMAYLKNLPVDELKVDRSFVSHMTDNTSDAVIVRSTVDLGRNLGLRVVAEGVEDQTTLEQLNALGCEAIQGYYISRPVPADDLLTWLKQQQAATPPLHPTTQRP